MTVSVSPGMRTTAAVLFLDLQEEILKNGRTNPAETVGRNATALAKLAALHHLPAFASSVEVGGAFLSGVLQALPELHPQPRVETDAFADAALVASIAGSGRRLLILSGVASEIVVQRTALAALAAGYTVHVAVDATSGVSARTEDAAWRRIVQAGGVTTSVTTVAAELAGDFTTDIGRRTLGIMYETLAG